MLIPCKISSGTDILPVPQRENFLVGSRGWAGDPAPERLIENGARSREFDRT